MYNAYLVIPIAVWAITQTLKFTLAAWQGRIDLKYFYASGGMPSVHSAVVSSLATTALILDGAESHLFGLTVILAAIVMYDSFGVRRASGEQAAALNMLIGSLGEGKVRLTNPSLRLREVLGHKPSEVLVGALTGIFLASVFNVKHLDAQLAWLSSSPGATEQLVYAIIFGLMIIGGIGLKFVLDARYRQSPTMKALGKTILIKTQVLGWPGLLFYLAQRENLAYYSWRAWPLLLLVGLLAWDGWTVKRHIVPLKANLAAEQAQASKKKWFAFGKKKRKK